MHLPWEQWAGPSPGFTIPEAGSLLSRFVFMPRGGMGSLTDDAGQAVEAQVFGQRYFDQTLLGVGTPSLAGFIKADGSVPFTADQSMGSHKLTNVTDPGSAQDAATKAYVDSVVVGFDPIQAQVFGAKNPNPTRVTPAAFPSVSLDNDPTADSDAVRFSYLQYYVGIMQARTEGLVNSQIQAIGSGTSITGLIKADGSVPFAADESMGNHKLTDVTDPTNAQDAATKAYVDSVVVDFDPVQAMVFSAHPRPDVAYTTQTNTFMAPQSMGGFAITDVDDPTNAQDAATKAYVDSVAVGFDPVQARVFGTRQYDQIKVGIGGYDAVSPAFITGGVIYILPASDMIAGSMAAADYTLLHNTIAPAIANATDVDDPNTIALRNGSGDCDFRQLNADNVVATGISGIVIQVGADPTDDTDVVSFSYLRYYVGIMEARLKGLLQGVIQNSAGTTYTGTAPIVVTGSVISISASSGASAGSMSAAHYTLVNGATASSTVSTLVLRDGSGVAAFAGVTLDNDPVVTTDAVRFGYLQYYVGVWQASARAYADSIIKALSASYIVSGTLAVARGGTGMASYAVGDIIYASGSTTLAALADVATGNALISGGVTTAPAWGKIGLTTHVDGTLGAANGGTGVANNAASTITISGNFATTLTVTGATGVTLPTTGTLATLAGSESLTNKKLGSLTTNGYVQTSGGDGTLSVDTSTFRVRLTASRTYYVRTDGSDSNDGLANTAGGAFLTIQKAIDVASALDNGGFDITIQIGNGTYTSDNTLKSFVGSGNIIIIGDTTTPSNVVVSTTSATCFTATSVIGIYILKGMQWKTTTSGHCLLAYGSGTHVKVQNVDFNTVPTGKNHVECDQGALVNFIGNYTISGGAGQHWYSFTGQITASTSITVTLTGTPAWATAGVSARGLAMCNISSITYSGSATGKRYVANENSVIFASGVIIPGSVAGTTGTGGQYV